MAKGFKLPILADVRDFIKGTDDVDKALEEVADSLESVGEDGKDLNKTFSQAYSSIRADSKKTGKAIGDDVKHGTAAAAEGMGELKDEAAGSAREAAASFSGEFDDAADYVQEVLAQALSGFGPVGAAAGIAAAAGIGFLISSLQTSAEKAEEAKQEVIDLANELADVDGNPAAIDWAEHLREKLSEVTDSKSWWEFWQSEPKTRLEEWSDAADKLGVSLEDALAGLSGDNTAWSRFLTVMATKSDAAARATQNMIDEGIDPAVAKMTSGAHQIESFKDELVAQRDVVDESTDYYGLMESALSGVSDAQQIAAEATSTYESAVTASLEKAGESWEDYTSGGVVNLDAYNAAIEQQASSIQAFEENLASSSSKLSADALAYVQSLGPDAAPLLQAFADAPLDQQQRTAANWDTIGKASTKGYEQSLKLDQATNDAVAKAKGIADANPIMVKTKLSEQLAYEAQRAIAGVGTLVIPVKLQASKTVY